MAKLALYQSMSTRNFSYRNKETILKVLYKLHTKENQNGIVPPGGDYSRAMPSKFKGKFISNQEFYTQPSSPLSTTVDILYDMEGLNIVTADGAFLMKTLRGHVSLKQ